MMGIEGGNEGWERPITSGLPSLNRSAHAQLARGCVAIAQAIPVKEFVVVPTGDLECYCAFSDWSLIGDGCPTGL